MHVVCLVTLPFGQAGIQVVILIAHYLFCPPLGAQNMHGRVVHQLAPRVCLRAENVRLN